LHGSRRKIRAILRAHISQQILRTCVRSSGPKAKGQKLSRTFEQDFKDLLKAIRGWAEIGNPMPAKNANEKLSWLFQQHGVVSDTPAGREQQRTAQRRLQEALHQATAHAAESGKP
jgi:hypothetical protein